MKVLPLSLVNYQQQSDKVREASLSSLKYNGLPTHTKEHTLIKKQRQHIVEA